MALLRIVDSAWDKIRAHLASGPGEHFAFLLATPSSSPDGRLLIADDVHVVDDQYVARTPAGWVVSTAALISAINHAREARKCLIEVHNHAQRSPRFSRCDRAGLQEVVPYVLSSLSNRPYGALVTGCESEIYGEVFDRTGRQALDRITVVGTRLEVIGGRAIARRCDLDQFDRQLRWLTPAGQRHLGALRVVIGGAGGLGSHAALALAYLGARDFGVIDGDLSDPTSLHRLATGRARDAGKHKASLAGRAIRAIAPDARVRIVPAGIQDPEALVLAKSADLLVGCFDNDGARLIWNELAVAYRIPYLDFAVGIRVANDRVLAAGGRFALVLPDGPCLRCMSELDLEEARSALRSAEEQTARQALGYTEGVNVPEVAVYSLNGTVVNLGMTELTVLLSRLRTPMLYADYDVLGYARALSAQWLGPVTLSRRDNCVVCVGAGLADGLGLERRYAVSRQAA